MARIILNMIVKDEADIIERCLNKVLPYVDGFCILDTGSTDDTIRRIMDNPYAMKLRPSPFDSCVYQVPFENFAQARNEALTLAKEFHAGPEDYILFLSARAEMVEPFDREKLKGPAYSMDTIYGNLRYSTPKLVQAKHAIEWVGAVHEYLKVDCPMEKLPGLIKYHCDGSNREGRIERYLDLLLQDYEKDPNNPRTTFYLANSYFDLKKYKEAICFYKLRLKQGGFFEEVWYSQYRIAMAKWFLKYPVDEISKDFLLAYKIRPTRNEPIIALARLLKINQPYPKDLLFIEPSCYDKKPGAKI